MKKDSAVNQIFFVFFLFLLITLFVHHCFLIQSISMSSRLFFLFYSVCQITMEVLTLAFLGQIVKKHCHKPFYSLFIAFTFIWFMSHFLDFVIVRLLNLSVWSAFELFILNETFENLIELLQQSGVSLWAWLLMVPLIAVIPILGILFYRFCERISSKPSPLISSRSAKKLLWALPLFMVAWDLGHLGSVDNVDYKRLKLTLPWKGTLFEPHCASIAMKGHLKEIKSDPLAFIGDEVPIENRPNLLLIVAESLRDDYISELSAPHLSQFKRENVSFESSMANANATHLSWFSIFHSRFAYQWDLLRQNGWKNGALPLQMLKKMGYQIRVYSSAELKYYGVDELIFGENNALMDSCAHFSHHAPKEAWEADMESVKALIHDLDNPELQSGQLMILFLDSTHFNYSWDPEEKPVFTPYASEINIFYACSSSFNLEKIKNRYRNALHYIDALFGRLRLALEERGLYENTLITVTGDHGEEFFEHGQIFHGSHLSPEQLNVPLYMKLPGCSQKRLSSASHVDIFPTWLHAIAGKPLLQNDSDGHSHLAADKETPLFSLRNRWSSTPSEFQLKKGDLTLHGEFLFNGNALEVGSVRVIDVKDSQGKRLHFKTIEEMNQFVERAFKPDLQSFLK